MKTTHPQLLRAVAPLLISAALFTGPAAAEAINGAIFTSTYNGTTVNANLYDSKADVYLNGGPTNAPGCHGGSLDDGDYYFQVTNPSGSVLLSSDGIAARKFRVSGGEISQNLGTHAVGVSSPCGSLAIQLLPYADTPNNGGVYKAWITRVSDFVAACGGIDCGKGGFVGGSIKTDNFKVKTSEPPTTPTGAIKAIKFYDANANGLYDAGDIRMAGWEMTLESVSEMVSSTQFTAGASGSTTWFNLMLGSDYTVLEGTPVENNWVHSATIFSGHDGSPINPAGPLSVVANQTTVVKFGNYCTIPSGGKTLGFWSNKNGKARFLNDADNIDLQTDLALMVALNLRDAYGTPVNPGSYAQFRTWILSANATNMAYMLSAQLAAMELNVHNGFVSASAYYVPFGGTIGELMALADISLGSDGLTLAGHPERGYQEALKNYLDDLNNGAGVLSPTPCPYNFD